MSGTSGSDTINNNVSCADHVTIDTGAGNDYIHHSGYYVSGYNDGWQNGGSYVSINGGDGDDYIRSSNYVNYTTIEGGADDDYIFNTSSNYVTINGGDGNDIIQNVTSSSGLLIQYSQGDGNDTISGFNENSTLEIGGGYGTYVTQTSGNDVIVYVGDGSIVLSGAASLGSGIYINGVESELPAWRINGTTATYGTSYSDR